MDDHSIDLFLSACGARGPLRIATEDRVGGEIRRRICPQPFVLIGRSPRSDLVLDHPDVSRRHVYVQVVAGRVFCLDLESRTGLARGGEPGRSAWSGPGRPIDVGPYRIGIGVDDSEKREGPDPPDPMKVPALGDERLPRVVLKFPDGNGLPPRLGMDRVLVLLGRSRGCHLRLPGSTVSRFHCGLLRTTMGLWVIDLLARGGIRVNGADVRWSRLNDDDELVVGEHRIILRCDATGTSVYRPAGRAATPVPIVGPYPALALATPAGIAGPAPEGGPPARPEVLDPVLGTLVHQFSLMQQQLFDQYNQSMMMMSQMFGALQRDHMGLVREELDRLQKLTQELQALQAEASARPGRPEAPPEPAAAALPPPPRDASTLPGQAADDVHARLMERIATIQEERQTRWQKILSMVTGASGGQVVP